MSLLNRVYSPPPASAFLHPHSTLICFKGFSKNHQAESHWLQDEGSWCICCTALGDYKSRKEKKKFPLLVKKGKKKKESLKNQEVERLGFD